MTVQLVEMQAMITKLMAAFTTSVPTKAGQSSKRGATKAPAIVFLSSRERRQRRGTRRQPSMRKCLPKGKERRARARTRTTPVPSRPPPLPYICQKLS